jgi:hypothetical protein
MSGGLADIVARREGLLRRIDRQRRDLRDAVEPLRPLVALADRVGRVVAYLRDRPLLVTAATASAGWLLRRKRGRWLRRATILSVLGRVALRALRR